MRVSVAGEVLEEPSVGMLGAGRGKQGQGTAEQKSRDFTEEGACGWREDEAVPHREKGIPAGGTAGAKEQDTAEPACLRNRDPSLPPRTIKWGGSGMRGAGAPVFFPFLSLSPSSHLIPHH